MIMPSTQSSVSRYKHGCFTKPMMDSFANWGDKMALIDGPSGKGIKYSELKGIIDIIAGNFYHVAGVRKGEVVCIWAPNSVEYTLLLMALPSIGGIVTACNPMYSREEIVRQLTDANAKYLVVDSRQQNMVPELLAAKPQIREVFVIGKDVKAGYTSFDELLKPTRGAPEVVINAREDVFLLPYSSGTTGMPKGVMLTHLNFDACLQAYLLTSKVERYWSDAADGRILQLKNFDIPNIFITNAAKVIIFHFHINHNRDKDFTLFDEGKETSLITFPLCFLGGPLALFQALQAGCTNVILEKYEFETYLAANQKYKATQMYILPTIMAQIVKSPVVSKYDLSSVTKVFYGSAPCSAKIETEFLHRMPNVKSFRQGYSLTECSGAFCVQPIRDIKRGSVGKVLPILELKVVDIETGKELPPGQEGEIIMRGPTVMKGYLNQPEKTAETIRNGWLHTGDIGKCDIDGYVYLTDRLKELIKYKGYQVAPAELESLLVGHPAIAEAAVIGVPDPHHGELPRAYVVLKPGHKATADDIKNFVQEHVAPYKFLRGGVEFVSAIPKSPSGKVLRKVLKDKVLSVNAKL